MEHHDHDARIARVRKTLDELGLDTFMVTVPENRRYLSGYRAADTQFDETAGALLITADRLLLATDSRFELEAARQAPGFERYIYKKGLDREISAILSELGTRRLGFESVRLSVLQFETIRAAIAESRLAVETVATEGIVERLRLKKSRAEIEAIRRALLLAESAFQNVLDSLSPGITEAALAWTLERSLREAGADALSFDSIVAAGVNAALPHAVPSDRKIASGEPVLFDWGVRLNGYCSDISRTVVIDEPDDRFARVFAAVREAQEKAIEAIRPGMSGKAVDQVARDHIERCGFGGRFGHGLGHGVGLAIHEAPRLSPVRDDILEPGMVVTVEPGVYLPDWGGVRLENMVVITENGAEVLNRMPVNLTPLG
ncbi:MAG: aminopeptidase P family protein [Desulfobacterales bacterium]|jgi:Xaa-Pro aminopeptidase